MDFIEKVKQFSIRVETLKNSIRTEEATKTSIIMPFFAMLGYDVFDPSEFMPEFIADVGIKKGEKVDYAIIINNEPVMLIEAKSVDKNLERHDSQLFRYFGTTRAKFAILTNGLLYRFYTDIDERNKMDREPFLEINMLKIKDSQINELKKFTKDNFDVNAILDTASLLKDERKFKQTFSELLQNPTDEFVKLFLQDFYTGQKTQTVIEKYRPILKKSLNDIISETLNEKILLALENTESKYDNEPVKPDDEGIAKLSTSDDELEAFFIVKTILKSKVDMIDLYYKKTESYFVILYKNNVRKWICRLILTDSQKSIILPDANKKLINKFTLTNLTDIMDYKNQIIDVIKRYTNTILENDTPEVISQSESYQIRLLPRPPHKVRTLPNKHLRYREC